MTFEGPVEDRLALRELLDAYGAAVIGHDAESWQALWADDAVWNLRGRTIEGRTAIGAAWRQAMAAYRFVAFMTFPARMRIDGEAAQAVSHTLEFLTPHDGASRRQHGRYEDAMVRRDGVWLFARRSFTPLDVA